MWLEEQVQKFQQQANMIRNEEYLLGWKDQNKTANKFDHAMESYKSKDIGKERET